MNGILDLLKGLADADGDGKLTISDLPGLAARIMSARELGAAIVKTADEADDVVRAAVKLGSATTGGRVVTDQDWEDALAPWQRAAERAQALMAETDKDGDDAEG